MVCGKLEHRHNSEKILKNYFEKKKESMSWLLSFYLLDAGLCSFMLENHVHWCYYLMNLNF